MLFGLLRRSAAMSQPIDKRRQALMDQAIAERKRLRDWLLPYMADGKPKAFTKDEYRQLATADLGAFPKAAFDHAWIAPIRGFGLCRIQFYRERLSPPDRLENRYRILRLGRGLVSGPTKTQISSPSTCTPWTLSD